MGIVLAAFGVIGFFNDPIFGIFAVDIAHNLLFVIFGLAAIAGSFQEDRGAENFAKGLGWVFVVLGILGFLWPAGRQLLWIFQYNTADSVLHLGIGIVSLIIGYAGSMAGMGRYTETHRHA